MTIRPIIFSEPMVKALLAGRKTQTRRLGTSPLRNCEVGDLLYVREAFAFCGKNAYPRDALVPHPRGLDSAIHRAGWDRSPPASGWRPSIHMPRWASRLTLKVTRVRIDRLNSIDGMDAVDEGIALDYPGGHFGAYKRARHEFRELWNTLHTEPGETWADNPMIVALSFDVIHGNVDAVK